MVIYHQEINVSIKKNKNMIIDGTAEMGYPFEDLHDYYLYYLISDVEKSKLISPNNIPENYDEYVKGALSKAIENKNYGTDIDKIFIILICRQGVSHFKVRKRYDSGNKSIGVDCILNPAIANLMKLQEEKIYLLQELKKTFTSIQTYKKKLKNFDFDAFEKDIQAFLDAEIKRIENTSN